GRVEQLDEPSRIYSFPKSRFVADFIGTCNLLEGSITSSAGGIVAIDVDGLGVVRAAATGAPAAGTAGTIALRPEKIRMQAAAAQGSGAEPEDNHFRGTVIEYLYLGDVTVYIVTTPGGRRLETLLANSAAGRTQFFEVGDAVEIGWPAGAGHFIGR
ncbi:MAG: TOBE domain-containing protein, partial [Casimicrobiaceae bacterium]